MVAFGEDEEAPEGGLGGTTGKFDGTDGCGTCGERDLAINQRDIVRKSTKKAKAPSMGTIGLTAPRLELIVLAEEARTVLAG